MPHKETSYLTVWDDTVTGKDLIIALAISTPLTLGGFIYTPWPAPMPLIVGLCGALLGFAINAIVLRPKRRLDIEKEA
ncbi:MULTISPECIES: hypothetical protein [Halomonas]|uniref:Uncharacterized protein n=1 Tax=Halomonas casei TaxID=2742613 RepID=A0ABR9EWZ9_9GAMM|nr:hypothetical protein [Halomonas casei]MBE0398747.1 hypothetical protein [Halomonas casei]